MKIPEKFKDLPEIKPEELLGKLRNKEVIEGCTIRDAALEALHRAFFEDVPVELKGCLIDGDLDFIKGQPMILDKAKELSQELRDKMKKRSVEEVILVKTPLSIIESFIKGRVLGSSHLRGGLSVIKEQVLGNLDLRKSVIFPNVSFSYTQFGNIARFGGITFSKETNFDGATFGKGVYFEAAIFGEDANFGDTTFIEGARFTGATFGDRAKFFRSNFGDKANFGGATFGERAYFSYSTFNKEAIFKAATFGEETYFTGAIFCDIADFKATSFGEGTNFGDTSFQGAALFLGRKAQMDDKDKEEARPIFNGEVDFRNADLEAPEKARFKHVNLKKARFLETPMDEVKFIDVDWAEREGRKCVYDEIADEPKERDFALLAQLYRQLKKNYEEARDYPGAGDFHYGEMEMMLAKHWANGEWYDWLITRSYKLFSGYGQKSGRALLWALGILLVPSVLYHMNSVTLGIEQKALESFMDYFVRSLGFMTFRIFQPPNELWAKVLMSAQAIFGPIQLALVALALRRKFRR